MFKKITRKNLDAFLAHHASSERVLDIGAGGSGYGKFFPNRLSVDIDPLRKPDIVADAHALPFKDNEFSTVLCTEVLEHVRDPKTVLSEIYRVLKPGGVIILTTRFVYPLHDTPHDYWRFTKYGLAELFKGFRDVEIIPEAKSFTTLAILFQRLAFQGRFHIDKLVKLKLFIIAFVLQYCDWLIVKQYADIKKSKGETDICASGYYVSAKK